MCLSLYCTIEGFISLQHNYEFSSYNVTPLCEWGIFVITGFRLQSPAGGAPSRSQQMRFVVPVNNTKIGYEPILI